MKITTPIVWLASIISGFISLLMYEIIVPAINSGGECVKSYDLYALAVGSHIEDNCQSLIGFEIPMWWFVSSETSMPISLLFGLFCGAVVALVLLVRMRSGSDDKTNNIS